MGSHSLLARIKAELPMQRTGFRLVVDQTSENRRYAFAEHGVVVARAVSLINANRLRDNALMHDKLHRLVAALTTGLYERDQAIRLALLATLAGESIFFLGPPGVGKSLIARRMSQAIADATSFEYLMGRFSTPDEVFGPLSISHLRDHDAYERKTERYLPDAHVVFLDEIWKASPPIQNALLTALNERLFRNGTTEIRIPMEVFIGASNELPDPESGTEAFWDRFLIRLVLDPITGERAFISLISDVHDVDSDPVPTDAKLSLAEIHQVREQAENVRLPEAVIEILARTRHRLAASNSPGQTVSDRRWKKIAWLLRVSAVVHGRDSVSLSDLEILLHCTWNTREARPACETAVTEVLHQSAGARAGELEPLRTSLEQLRSQAQTITTRHTSVERTEPVLFRDEYVRLLDHPEAEMVLLWRGDLDELQPGEPTDVELFAYTAAEQFSHTFTQLANRRSEDRIQIDGAEYRIDSHTITDTVAESRSPEPDERDRWQTTMQRLGDEIADQIDTLHAEAQHYRAEAEDHLFLHPPLANAIATGLEHAIAERNNLLIAAGEVRSDFPDLT